MMRRELLASQKRMMRAQLTHEEYEKLSIHDAEIADDLQSRQQAILVPTPSGRLPGKLTQVVENHMRACRW